MVVGRRAGRPEEAIDPDAGPVERFAWELRRLREDAGAPGYRALAERAHYSPSTLAEAARGRRLPTLEVTLAYAQACGGDGEEWRARWQAAADLVTPVTTPHAGEECPYPGLAPFQEQDAEWFFGRDELVTRLAGTVTGAGPPGLTAVFGASGSGKSSLIRAGLLPALPEGWRARVITPGAHPLAVLNAALPSPAEGSPAGPGSLRTEPDAPLGVDAPSDNGGTATGGARPGGGARRERLLLVVDQFEETFTLCVDAAERTAFIRAIVTAARAHPERLRVVLAVRADFYAHCSSDPALVVALRDGTQMPIGAPGEAELRVIITGPAAKAGLGVEAGLVVTLAAEAAGRPGSLPLLSHALRETWRRRQGATLSLADYQAGGGLRGGIAQTAEAIYLSGDDARRRMMRTILLRLTALGQGTEDTRRRIQREELSGVGSPAVVADLLEELTRARLIVLDQDTVEVAHEAVISAWPRLRGWLVDGRADLRTHRRLTQAALAWRELGRDRGALLRGGQLAAVRTWAGRWPEDLNELEAEYIAASAAADRRRGRLARRLVAAMAVLLAVAVTAAVTAVRARESARDQRDVALAEKVAGEAAALRKVDPALAAQLSLAAYRLAPGAITRSSLMSGFSAPFATRLALNVNTFAFSSGGRTMATGGDDRTVRLWDISAPHRPALLTALPGQSGDVESLAFTAGGGVLIGAGYDGRIRIWHTASARRPALVGDFAAHDDAVFRALPGPDGRTLYTASADGSVRVWDVARPGSPVRLAELSAHRAAIVTAALSRDGRTLATGAEDGTTRLWSVEDPRRPAPLARLPARTERITGVAFAPDGRTLAVAGFDHETVLWDLAGRQTPVRLAAVRHPAPLQTVAFSPDGRMVATGGWDYTVRLWDVSERRRPRAHTTLSAHTNTVWAVAFNPDGRLLTSAGSDGNVLLTDVPGPVLSGHGAALSTADLSPDGRFAVVGGEDFTARLWDVRDPGHPAPLSPLPGHTGQVKAVAFSGSGRLVATGAIDTRVDLWDISDPRRPARLPPVRTGADVRTVAFLSGDAILATGGGGRPGVRLWDVSDPRHVRAAGRVEEDMGALAVSFSPRGPLLAVVQDRDVHLWNVADPRRPLRVAGFAAHPYAVQKAVFSRDGRVLATAGLDGTARLWDVRDPAVPRPLAVMSGHVGGVQSVAFSPEGRTLASAGLDGTIRLWDVATASRPVLRAVLSGHADRVHAVTFGPGGGTLLSSGEDRTARLWATDPERVAARVCALAYPRVTSGEWRRFFPGLDFRPPCDAGRR